MKRFSIAFGLTLFAALGWLQCTRTPPPGGASPSVADLCAHLVQIGCGHDLNACIVGLGTQVDAGMSAIDLQCALDAATPRAAADCKGVGACPP